MAKNKKYKAQNGLAKPKKVFAPGMEGIIPGAVGGPSAGDAINNVASPFSSNIREMMNQMGNDGWQSNVHGSQIDFTRDTGQYDYHPAFKIFNALAQLTTGVANKFTDIHNSRDEQMQYLKALQTPQYENFNEGGLNDNPITFKTGGITKNQAYAILNSDEVKGHKLSRQQKIFFERIAKTGKMPAPNSINQNGGEAPQVVEAEQGEVYQDTEGALKKIGDSEPTHEQGGVDIADAQRILEDTSDKRKDKASQALKLNANLVSLLTGFEAKSDMTHSKAMEFAKKNIDKQVGKIQGKIEKNVEVLKKDTNNRYANNSLKLNSMQMSAIPTEGQVFDQLFQHQELLKGALGIENPKAKYGKYVAQFGTYNGGKTPGGKYTPTKRPNNFSYEGGLEGYKKAWAPFFDLSQYKDAASAQGATYDYLLYNAPDVLRGMWKEFGNTAQGLKSGLLTDKYKDGNFSNADLSDEDLKTLRAGYVDNMLGARTLTPAMWEDPKPAAPAPAAPAPVAPGVPPQQSLQRVYNKDNRFYEPLRWFDVAGPIGNLLENRIPAKYNGAELHQIRMKQQNPLPSLQAGQRDFNAVTQGLPQNGQGYGNLANVFSQKYNIDNQVLGQYENINSGIKNNETMYNAGVADKQSLLDQGARNTFENQRLGSIEAQRQQHTMALDELYTRLAQNRKLNREGNLLMQLFPAFDQYAKYNGYYDPINRPKDMPNTPVNVPLAPPAKAPAAKAQPKGMMLSNGKFLPFKF